jgi:hypothetical protein
VFCVFGRLAAQLRWKILYGCVEAGVRIATKKQFDKMLPQLHIGLHGEVSFLP